MNVFLRDIWHDLRATRLLPVAAVLGLALIALPVFLLNSQVVPSTESTPPGLGGGQKPQQAAVVSLADPASAAPSQLGVFDSKDPFSRAKDLDSGAKVKSSSGTSPGGTVAAGGAPLAGGSAGGAVALGPDAGASASGAAASSFGGDPPAGGASSSSGSAPSSPESSSPSSGSPSTPAPGTVNRTRTKFTYVADVKVGPTDKERTLKGIEAPKLLPTDESPLIVFLGAANDGKSALFFIDNSKLTSSGGKGECKPDSVTCSFLTLSTDDENDLHLFKDNDGARYSLRLLAISAKSAKSGSCEPGYSPCLPVTGDLDCPDIPSSKKPVKVTGGDRYRLDGDGDGVGCDQG